MKSIKSKFEVLYTPHIALDDGNIGIAASRYRFDIRQ